MTALLIDINTFTHESDKAGKGRFRHKIETGHLNNSPEVWFKKELENPTTAYLELLTQEFFRLIIPRQPETRIAKHPDTNVYYILSKEVPGFKDLPRNEQQNFTNGTYNGLGEVLLAAILVHDIDVKNGNIGLNEKNEVIKIDGDWGFIDIKDAERCSAAQKEITPQSLANLPYLKTLYFYNWLDLIVQADIRQTSKIVDHTVTNSPQFRQEINQAIWRILLIPDDYIKQFVDAYISVGSQADRFIALLKKRRDELLISALQNESFREYLATNEARDIAKIHLAHMKTFMAHGYENIVEESEYGTLEQNFLLRAIALMAFAQPKRTSLSLSAGFAAGCMTGIGLAMLVLALRLIDVATFGMSLPLTLVASAAIIAVSGGAMGMVFNTIQNLVNQFMAHRREAMLSAAVCNKRILQDMQRTADSKISHKNMELVKHSLFVHSILGPSSKSYANDARLGYHEGAELESESLPLGLQTV